MNTILKKYLKTLFTGTMTFVLLTGMSATVHADEFTTTPLTPDDSWKDTNPMTERDLPGFKAITQDQATSWNGAPTDKATVLFYSGNTDGWSLAFYENGSYSNSQTIESITKYAIYSVYEGYKDKMYFYYTSYTPASSSSSGSAPRHVQDQTLITGYIVNGKDANGNDTYATFSQDNVWSVTKVASSENSVTYDISTQWETYGTVHVGIPALGFTDGPVLVDQYKDGKLIGTYDGWVTWEYCDFDNPGGFGSTFVIRRP